MEPIAVTGFSFRLPQGAEDEASFWEMLVKGQNVMTKWPQSRANIDAFRSPSSNNVKNVLPSRGAHFLQGEPGEFDAPFFSITVNDAEAMDPQQRWILEASYRAMENAGIQIEKISGTETGVFVGSMSDDYAKLIYKDPDEAPPNTSLGTAPSILANRPDRGRSRVSIFTQRTELNIAGSNTILTPEETIHLGSMNFLSKDSQSYAFDHRANGYARGEGVIVLVLKRLADALQNGDMIRAVIRASGSNQDGHTPGITQPNYISQESLIRKVYRSCDLDFTATRYVEAHGTGTNIGDLTEAKAVGRVFRSSRSQDEPLYIGSVKTIIGHLEGASGLASMLKAILILERGIIPPNALFEKWNRNINFKANRLAVPTSCMRWPSAGVRRISVNSFGFGGSNCHLVLDDAFHFLEQMGADSTSRTPMIFMHLLNSSTRLLRDQKMSHDPTVGRNLTLNGGHEAERAAHTILDEVSDNDGNRWIVKEDLVNGSTHNGNSLNSPQAFIPPQRAGSSLFPSDLCSEFTLLVWSARDEAGLGRIIQSYQKFLKQQSEHLISLMSPLAYTLSVRRSLMQWRSFAVVSSDPNDIQVSRGKYVQGLKQPGLAFVFTGQGAQYVNMGLQLMAYPSFESVIVTSGTVLRDLGANWSTQEALTHSDRIHTPEVAQPLCTILQIALVELLRHFGVNPHAVVGHSSGEIAAAYAAGILSLDSALKVAFHRGRLAQKLLDSSSATEGMMSVNLSESGMESYVQTLCLTDDITVACVNSPNNVTVSGEKSAIGVLKKALQEEQIFAQQLSVDIAYHSPTMKQIAEEYVNCLGTLRARKHTGDVKPILMVSSVTGLVVPTSTYLNTQYWADNLVSRVRFADALGYLAAAAPKADGLKPVSTYVEVGPHGALNRPVKETLNSLNLSGNTSYLSLLSRHASPRKSVLETVGHLFASGHEVSILSANQHDTGKQQPAFLVHTPQYPFDHSRTYWYETRLSRGWRLRKIAPQPLLGTPVSDWNPLQPRWRKMLRISETPWLRDHVIAGEILYPATASLSMALEAVLQIQEATKAVTGFKIAEAFFMKPIVIHRDRATEVITHLRPLSQSHEKTTSRFAVNIFSVADDNWMHCFRSDIQVEFEESPNDVDGEQGPQALMSRILTRNYNSAKGRCMKKLNLHKFYESLAKQGLKYGPAFSLVENVCWDGDQLAVGSITPNADCDQYEGIVHPGLLDAACQLSYVPRTEGDSDKMPTAVPYAMRHAWISTTEWQNLSHRQIQVSTKSKTQVTGAGLKSSVSVLSKSGTPLFHIGELELRQLSSSVSTYQKPRRLVHRVEWEPDVSLLSPNQLREYCIKAQAERRNGSPVHTEELNNTLKALCQYYFDKMAATDWANVSSHIQEYLMFLRAHLQQHGEKVIMETPNDLTVNNMLKKLVSNDAARELFVQVATGFPLIVRDQVSVSQSLQVRDLMNNYYEELISHFSDDSFKAFLKLAAHKNSSMRILEIEGGSGALTSIVISSFQELERQTGGTAFLEYIFTSHSECCCQQARERFHQHQDRMTFEAIEHGVDIWTQQGFKGRNFDMVIVGGALHANLRISTELREVHRMLKPGGHVVICDITAPHDFATNFILGLRPEWWQKPPLRVMDWDLLLKENGFCGTDLLIRDSNNETSHGISMMISTVSGAKRDIVENVTIILIVRDADDYQLRIAMELDQTTFSNPKYQVRIANVTQAADLQMQSADHIIFLVDAGVSFSSILLKSSARTFDLIKRAIQGSKSILWVSSPDPSGITNPVLDPYTGIKDGFLRSLRSEFQNKAIAGLSIESQALGASDTASLISTIFNAAFIDKSPDLDYLELDGRIHIARLVEDKQLNHELSCLIRPELRSAAWLPGPPLKLAMNTLGQLDTLHYAEDSTYYHELGSTEVEIEAKAWAVNFRDVFSALGRLNDVSFGLDCAGVVTRVGTSCRHVKPGDRVSMCAVDSMRMYPRCDEDFAVKIASSLSFEEACAVIIPGMTALQSLDEIARIKRGERVLIHAASGATGQLAIQIAQRAGAIVYATVGHQEKKRLLVEQYGIPASQIFYSRSTNATFARSLLEATNGYGVDVILNSLVGEGLRASWECIAPYGRFIEIGKTDIDANSSLPMVSFAQNATFASVDLRHMLLHRKDSAAQLLRQTMTMLSEGIIHHPKPLHVYNTGTIEDAFRYIQGGRNTGRVIIRIEPHTEVQKYLQTSKHWRFAEDATYLVAGGLGGIGRSLLKWMALRGARYLLVPSRSGPNSAKTIATITELEAIGVKVAAPKCDVSDLESLSQVLAECGRTMPRVRGCINATMELNDTVFDNMSYSQWNRTTSSKVAASWNLHLALADVDFMIFLSSVSGIVGNPGQSNYAAGCTFQDALARFRNARGQSTTCIDLGVMRKIGVVAETKSLQQHFENESNNLGYVEEDELLAFLDIVCDPAAEQSSIPDQLVLGLGLPAHSSEQSVGSLAPGRGSLFSYFRQARTRGASEAAGSGLTEQFRRAKTQNERMNLVCVSLASRLARSLAIKQEDIDPGKPLHAYGVDSLVAVELRNWIFENYAADVAVGELVSGRTVEGVGELIEKSSQMTLATTISV
ncbi:polyketide synthase PksD [Xylariaceae sp. FL1272]|nr:polyketide synthase PksD [Xylariaceae sp. FL1272]